MKAIKKRESRTLQIQNVETNDNELTVSGYVNKVGSYSEILANDGEIFKETILPQAFTNALQRAGDIDFYLEHDEKQLLATTKNGSLVLNQDEVGLHMKATIIDTSVGEDAYKLIKNGVITNMSFGFLALDDFWDYESVVPVRTVTDLALYEVSAVKNPAYLDSEISARCKKNKNIQVRNIKGISHLDVEKRGDNLKKELKDFTKEELQAELDKRDSDNGKNETEKRNSELLENVYSRIDKRFNEFSEMFKEEIRNVSKESDKQKTDETDETEKRSKKQKDALDYLNKFKEVK